MCGGVFQEYYLFALRNLLYLIETLRNRHFSAVALLEISGTYARTSKKSSSATKCQMNHLDIDMSSQRLVFQEGTNHPAKHWKACDSETIYNMCLYDFI